MLKFNNNNIFTGYLKQLLATFNLPKYHVYTLENKRYHDWAVAESKKPEVQIKPPLEKDIVGTIINSDNYPDNMRYAFYLKDDKIQKYVNNIWLPVNLQYYENKKELNQTKHLQIKNNIYDSYTHEYLGDFLRFIRDYYNINLMPLYNCFSNNLCKNLFLNIAISNTQSTIFNSADTRYKIYMIPVKLFKKYTIAIESDTTIEMCCGFYGAYQDTRDKLKNISDFTYKKVNSSKFKQPFIFDKLTSEYLDTKTIEYMELAQNEQNLKLFIKVPTSNNSSITVLEGDYSGYNNSFYCPNLKSTSSKWIYKDNISVTNYATYNEEDNDNQGTFIKTYLPDFSARQFNPITNLQLLSLNTGTSYPIADRLIEYLVGNVITDKDEISDNIKRAQLVLKQWNIPNTNSGIWDPQLKNIFYDYMSENEEYKTEKVKVKAEAKHDNLGYIDKDTEKYFSGPTTNSSSVSIANAYLYPNLYKDSQKGKN